MELSDTAWTKLAEASPYAVILVIVFIMFVVIYKIGIESLKASNQAAIKEIREAHRDASMRLDTAIQILNAKK